MLETQFYFIFDKYEVELYIANHSILNYTDVKAYGALLFCLFFCILLCNSKKCVFVL